jgi:ankyrin repeat protein
MSTPGAALRTASYSGDIAVVGKLLLEGVDPNVADKFGRTALSLAAGKGHNAIIDILLENGAWVDPHEDYDVYETPLMAAVEGGYFDTVKKLINAGANPLFNVGVSQRTAESYARGHGYIEIADYLLSLPRGL